MNQYGFIKIAAAVPKLKIADPSFNVSEILTLVRQAEASETDILLFPELSLTAYSCADLFLNNTLIRGAEAALTKLAAETENTEMIIVVGLPVSDGLHLYNCAAVLQGGRIRGIVPKSYLPDYGEFAEARWFHPAPDKSTVINIGGVSVPFGRLIFSAGDVKLAAELCEDLWVPVSPSALLSQQGAEIILNLSASNEVIGKRKYRKMLVQNHSYTSHCAYVFASAGATESTADTVYSGHVLAAENGTLLLDEQVLSFESRLSYTEIDIERIRAERIRINTFAPAKQTEEALYVALDPLRSSSFIPERSFSPQPFVPADPTEREERFAEIYDILSTALAKRLRHTGVKTAVIGISGGLDSTLALLIAARAMDLLQKPRTDILAVTMPGFGTTGRTLQNAQKLMQLLGTTVREISIKDACLQHFKDIGHDVQKTDVTYENTQARERTQILMDLANQTGGLVIGTGDLSELALGWATYAGDHISMYGINGGVPKTLIRHLVDWIGKKSGSDDMQAVLTDVLETPVSPELLPANQDGQMAQKTEAILGDYTLHDFFLYYFLRFGFTPEKILYLAQLAFAGIYTEEKIKETLTLFLRRFFQNQFKRSCLPDGPKIGSVSLSPRGDFHMPSDASGTFWLADK